MKTFMLSLAAMALMTPAAFAAPKESATAVVGQAAPDFRGVDTNGKEQTLSQYKGKTVVLEWTNPECPYVVKHYDSGNMQALQKEATDAGVIWLSVASSAADKEGYLNADESNKYIAGKKAAASARILDPSGTIGHLYGAKTTPHMYVIDPEGTLVYAGAIDDNDSFKPETIGGATNYVREALRAIRDGKPVQVSATKSYGCAVKYAN